MNEAPKLHERFEAKHEELDNREEHKNSLEHIQKAASVEHDHNIDKIQESIHKEAISAREVTVGEHRAESSQPTFGMQRELKADAYSKTMQKVRGHLSPVERSFSSVVHNRFIEPLSEFSGKTIARPSGILGSGIAALVGSSVVLYMAKHYGFRYNLTVFVLLLASGFVAGLIVELLVRLLWHRKRT